MGACLEDFNRCLMISEVERTLVVFVLNHMICSMRTMISLLVTLDHVAACVEANSTRGQSQGAGQGEEWVKQVISDASSSAGAG